MRNAIDAMEGSSRKELVVATTVAEDTNDSGKHMIEVNVADTGSGISEVIASRLFQPFVTTKPAGMGVGLSISKRIIEAHGGRIWAELIPAAERYSTLRSSRPRRAPRHDDRQSRRAYRRRR
ncbi:MAG: ATP-binding protein [Hyphomicrobiales bacterium]